MKKLLQRKFRNEHEINKQVNGELFFVIPNENHLIEINIMV